ncbi:MAG: colanic acid biosynthesis glycosyltransferase WcaI [Hymenobacter sp.]|nr:MAG: colanic acid biosynthesis glycosyltransferase WcaI [Hymenobacter sp.]
MKKKFLLIGYNFYPEPTGIGKYSGEMLYWLAENGYECTAITAYPYYPYWKIQEPYHKKRFGYASERKDFSSGGSLTIHRCPMYVPTKPSGMKRMLLDFSFLISASLKLLQLTLKSKIDTVFVVAPSFHFGLLGVLYKKIKNGQFIYHIQDMQIEAARDLKMITLEKVISALFKLEQYIFSNADIISSISNGMAHRIQEKANKPVTLFPNWTDTELFYPIEDKAALKIEFGFKSTDKIILYSGAIGEKQGLEAILAVAKNYHNNHEIKFVICGSGPYKQTLQALATSLGLHHVVFFPLQPLDKFNRFLNTADVHLVIQKANASDLVMPSKITTILAIGGLAVITANEESSLYSLIQTHNMGILVPAENQQALNAGIEQALVMNSSNTTRNARTYAENYLAINKIMKNFKCILN